MYNDGDEKEMERDMYMTFSYFRGSDDQYEYEKWESNLEAFFSYFILTSEQKYCYAHMRLIREAYWWWKNNHSSCRYWFVLQDLLHTWYALHFLFTESRETLGDIQKIIEGMAIKVETDSEPLIFLS